MAPMPVLGPSSTAEPLLPPAFLPHPRLVPSGLVVVATLPGQAVHAARAMQSADGRLTAQVPINLTRVRLSGFLSLRLSPWPNIRPRSTLKRIAITLDLAEAGATGHAPVIETQFVRPSRGGSPPRLFRVSVELFVEGGSGVLRVVISTRSVRP
jgi:hypothetical protein